MTDESQQMPNAVNIRSTANTFDDSTLQDVVNALAGRWDEFLRLAARQGAITECGRYWRDRGSAPGHEWNVEHLSDRLVPADRSTEPVWRVSDA